MVGVSANGGIDLSRALGRTIWLPYGGVMFGCLPVNPQGGLL